MSYVLRFGTIVSLVGLFLCGLAYLKPDILADVSLNIWDGPRQLGHLHREKNRSKYIEDLKRKIAVRRAEVHQILQALCREEIGLGEAAVRVKALETDENLPPLLGPLRPDETWKEKLNLWIVEGVRDELANDPEGAGRLLRRLEKEGRGQWDLPKEAAPSPPDQRGKKPWEGQPGAVPRPIPALPVNQ